MGACSLVGGVRRRSSQRFPKLFPVIIYRDERCKRVSGRASLNTDLWSDLEKSIARCDSCPAGEYYAGGLRRRYLQALASELVGRESEIRVLVVAESPPKMKRENGKELYNYYYCKDREKRPSESPMWRRLDRTFGNWVNKYAVLNNHDDVAVVFDCAQCAVNMWKRGNAPVRTWCARKCLSLHLVEMIEAAELDDLQDILIAMPRNTWYESTFEMFRPIRFSRKLKKYSALTEIAEALESIDFRNHVFVSSIFG